MTPALPEHSSATPLVQPHVVSAAPALQVSADEQRCLALNVYYEAGIEADIGKFAVAHVTLNRLETGRWGDSICEVVHAYGQFSWTHHLERLQEPSGISWHQSQAAARKVLGGARVVPLERALYYHATYVQPYWRRAMRKILRIGQHVFYAERKTSLLDITRTACLFDVPASADLPVLCPP